MKKLKVLILVSFIFILNISCINKESSSVTTDNSSSGNNVKTPANNHEDISKLFFDVVNASINANNEELLLAINKIKQMDERITVPWLKDAMITDKFFGDWAATILTEIGTENVAKALLEGAVKSEMPTVENENITKLSAIRGLGELKYKEAIPFLVENIRGEYSGVSRYSAKALTNIDSNIAAKEIEARLMRQDTDWRTHTITARRDFVDLLAEFGTKESINALEITEREAKKLTNLTERQRESISLLLESIENAKKKIIENN